MNHLRESLSYFWNNVYGFLFPFIEEETGPLNEKQMQLIAILEMTKIEKFIPSDSYCVGRPTDSRQAIARAFVAKSVYNIPTTCALIERLTADATLRRICGWFSKNDVPGDWTFSRAFAEFSETSLPAVVHESLIKATKKGQITGHVSRDSTEIDAREKAAKKPKEEAKETQKFSRGRPKKSEIRPSPEPTRLEKQQNMSLDEMLKDLPKACDIGTKKNSNGFKVSWKGYKLHIDAADGQIPISCILTSASLHDSQAALPLALITKDRTESLYDLMDAAYDSKIIRDFSENLGHVPIIDFNQRRGEKKEFDPAKKERYKERTNVERVNSRLKDEFGGKTLRVRGHAKVFTHLMFGILALTADQLMKFII